jgi:hypothetical protein
MDKQKAQNVRKVLNKLFEDNKELLEKAGITAHAGNATFDTNDITYKVNCVDIVKGKVVNVEAEAFKKNAFVYGLDENDLNKTFRIGNEVVSIVGFNSRARKNKFILESNVGGKRYVASIATIRNGLKNLVA